MNNVGIVKILHCRC